MHTLKQRLKHLFEKTGLAPYYYEYYPFKPIYIPTFWSYLRISRWNVYFRLRVRMFYYLLKNGFKVLETTTPNDATSGQAHMTRVIQRNFFGTHCAVPFARRRTEHLIYLLNSIPSVNKNGRLLSIGPRNEGDLLLLQAHGYTNVEGIDLFTYSPMIRLMDMHHMDFPDNTFDLISCGWVVRYSYDIQQLTREMVRVCKNGAVIAIGFSMNPHEKDVQPSIGTLLHGGVDELLGYFKPHISYVYWRLEDQNTDETNLPECTNSVVFKIKKP
jgi:SAM-dependent methyltransferase